MMLSGLGPVVGIEATSAPPPPCQPIVPIGGIRCQARAASRRPPTVATPTMGRLPAPAGRRRRTHRGYPGTAMGTPIHPIHPTPL